uniref:Uncharacterized protein n=1 Tax=Thermofilum pendens TaxID=2269 RepID=A0A7C1TB49_THEPE
MSAGRTPHPKRWVPTYIVLLASLLILSAALALQYLRTGSDSYLVSAAFVAIIAVYTGWSFARLISLKVAPKSLVTLLKCTSCGHEVVRGYREGDTLFTELDQCPKCGSRMVAEGIFLKEEKR